TYTNVCGQEAAPIDVTYTWGMPNYGTDEQFACGSFELNGVTYTESQVITYTIPSANACGCDSIVTLTLTVDKLALHVAAHADEVCGDDGSVTVAETDGLEPIEYSLDGVTYQSSNVFNGLSDGTYTLHARDANGCEATTTVTIAPAPIAVLTLTCPPTHHDTLAYGDCVMEIYPEAFGTPTATIYPAEWPFEITNDIPADNLYYEGVTMITYTMTDQVCGNTVTCTDSVVVVFPQCPDAVDCEGNVYHGVRIGCDCWTQTNLLSNCYGEPNECVITGTCDDPIPCVYEYESDQFPDVDENVDIYGRLYCAEAALDDSVINENGHIQGICPEGWYLPTPEQYEQLYLYGGGTSILTADGLRSNLYWFDGGGNNATGFSALPAGMYNGATQQFERMTLDTYFWATEIIHGEVHITSYRIQYDCDEVQRVDIDSGYGISVRCVKEKN
ncbi:MAG: fibrobacter succinogenes major paralogous domain-containing protein, partial [Bacteroidales bacterium]|nr:fibrobacter succinogenes major paralogous domain-containing protein [Bacteroidales bacterium]